MADLKDLNQFGTKQQQEILKAVFIALEEKGVDHISSLESYVNEVKQIKNART